MSVKNTNYKFKLKRTPEQSSSALKFPSGNLNLEILKLVKKLSTNQEELSQYIVSEISTINEKLNFIMEKFNQIEVEVDENAENGSQEEDAVEIDDTCSYNKLEDYELEEQETEALDPEQEDDQEQQEVQEQEQDESGQVYYEISQDRDIADINPDNMLTLLYDPKTKKEATEHKVLINVGRQSFVQFEQIDVMPQMESTPNKKQKTKHVSEKYFPKIEKKSSEENPYSAAGEEELLTFPIKCLDHLEAIENILNSNTEIGAQFREELILRLQVHTPHIRDPSKVVEEISKSCFRQIVTDDVLQYFCWINKFPKQYPFLNEMRKYLFFSDAVHSAWARIFPTRNEFELSMKKVIRGTRIRFHLNRRRSNARINKSTSANLKDTTAEYMEFVET